MNKDRVNLIVAVGKEGEIGKKGDLIWKISEDLKRFKSLTNGHPVIMGRKTWESLPKRPLPNRLNIVITHRKDFMAEGAIIAHSVGEALEACEKNSDPFIIGGAEIYNNFLPFVSHLYLTRIDETCADADAFLNINLNEGWDLIEETDTVATPEGINYKYATYRRQPK